MKRRKSRDRSFHGRTENVNDDEKSLVRKIHRFSWISQWTRIVLLNRERGEPDPMIEFSNFEHSYVRLVCRKMLLFVPVDSHTFCSISLENVNVKTKETLVVFFSRKRAVSVAMSKVSFMYFLMKKQFKSWYIVNHIPQSRRHSDQSICKMFNCLKSHSFLENILKNEFFDFLSLAIFFIELNTNNLIELWSLVSYENWNKK